MLTLDSPELNINYTGFSDGKIKFIKETFILLDNILLDNILVEDSETIDGTVFEKPGYNYWIKHIQNGIHAIINKGEKALFGLYISTKEDGTKDYLVYHLGCCGNPGAPSGNRLDDYY